MLKSFVMNEKEYRAHPAISRSELWRIRESPEKFKYYRDNPPEPTPALVFGQLYHKLALQPETVFDEFAVAPEVDGRTKYGKSILAAFTEEAAGKTVVTADMWDLAHGMCAALRADTFCRELLSGEKETTYLWIDEMTGVKCKCRCDITLFQKNNDIPLVIDLKTTTCAKPNVFNKEIFKHGYHFQGAMYTEGVMKTLRLPERPEFHIIAQEKTPPYAINRTIIGEDAMRKGVECFREFISRYYECNETGYWYGYNGPFGEPNETDALICMSTMEKENEE